MPILKAGAGSLCMESLKMELNRLLVLASGLAVAMLGRGTCAAQSSQPAQSPKTAVVTFAPDPYRIDGLGLSIQLPEGSTTQLTRDGSKTTSRILAPDQSWLINIESHQSGSTERSLAEVTDAIRDQALGSVGRMSDDGRLLSTRGGVLERQSGLNLKGGAAERVYVLIPGAPAEQGRAQATATVHGYTVFNPAPGRYVTFQLLVPEPAFKNVAPIYESIIATASFVDPAKLGAERQQAVATGASLFSQLTSEDYQAVLDTYAKGKTRMDRLYQPSATGADDTELGYKRITAWKGQRGELDATRERARWTQTDKESGYVLKLEARIVDAGVIYDTISMFFLAEDRSTEAWLVRGSKREKGPVSTWTETGARDGNNMTVRIDPPSGPSQSFKPLIEGEGYISRLESALLPDLLMRKRLPGEYGFFVYQSESGTIRLRRDSLTQSDDRAGLWTLTTRLNDDAQPQTTLMNERAELVRVELPEGRVWEPTKLDRLVSLWRRAGLPLD